MVRVRIEMDEGLVTELDIDGHSTTAVCAALSSLARTYAELADRFSATDVFVDAPRPGEFYLRLLRYDGHEFIRGASAFLLEGIKGIAQDAPDVALYVGNTKIGV
jgi:uncharacterized protein YsxB (DUF464 family)